jgi:hypothetical protein
MGGRNSMHEGDEKYPVQNMARNIEGKMPLCETQSQMGE